jgi:small conductance mechanosensitive channel
VAQLALPPLLISVLRRSSSNSLSNLAAGFFILATRPFDIDDTIRTGTEIGTVKAMWIANTTIVTFDGRRLLIPNRKIWADIIENRSVEPLRRADITVRVGFDEDLDRTIEILRDLVQQEGRVLDHPEPSIFVSKWADSWVQVAVRPWTRNEDWWPLLQDLPRLVVQRFATEGIEIPYPRREVSGPGEGSAFEGPGAGSEPRP